MAAGTLRIIFMGTPEFAVPCLTALLEQGEQVVAVITQPDRPKGRGRKLAAPPVKEAALAAGIEVLQPTKIRTEEFLQQVRALQPDIIVVAAYGRILPGSLLRLPPLGTINVHGSLLPKYRGAAPIQWAIIRGEAETGITIMQMDEGLDTGDILLLEKLAITADDTAATLAVKLSTLGGSLLLQALNRLAAGPIKAVRQDETSATLAPPLSKDLGRIDWSASAFSISCLIRGLDPWPKAYTTVNSQQIKLFKPMVLKAEEASAPGTLLRADREGLLFATAQDNLLIREVQREGGKQMSVESFLRGFPLTAGICFE